MRELWEVLDQAELRLTCDSLQFVNNNYDEKNVDDASIALLLFLRDQGNQATKSPGELFWRENKL